MANISSLLVGSTSIARAKYKLKPQWDIIIYLLEWSNLKGQPYQVLVRRQKN